MLHSFDMIIENKIANIRIDKLILNMGSCVRCCLETTADSGNEILVQPGTDRPIN